MNELKPYLKQINKALLFIDEHLGEHLSLKEVSVKAGYSPYHFHRLFKAIIGEPLLQYIVRRRIEYSANDLIHNKKAVISDVFTEYGFSDHSTFSKSFKKYYGVSPTHFKNEIHRFVKLQSSKSKNGQTNLMVEDYFCRINNYLNWLTMNSKIEVKTIDPIYFAGLTHVGVEGLPEGFSRLIGLAHQKSLIHSQEFILGRVFYDSFKVTSPDKVRMSLCLKLDEALVGDDILESISIDASNYIVGRFEMKPEESEKAWTSLYVWMHENNYKKADKQPFELLYNDFRTHPEGKLIADLFIPIQ